MDIKDYFGRHSKIKKETVDKEVIKVLANVAISMDLLVHECPICYEVVQKHEMISTGECNHMFCSNCTNILCDDKKKQFSCPLCRTNVTKIVDKSNWRNPESSIVSLMPKEVPTFGRLIVLFHDGLLMFLLS